MGKGGGTEASLGTEVTGLSDSFFATHERSSATVGTGILSLDEGYARTSHLQEGDSLRSAVGDDEGILGISEST